MIRIEPSQVRSVYSGRPGCACGCKGNHSESQRSIQIVVKKILAAAEQGYKVDVDVNQFNSYVAVETDTRQYIAYI